MSVGMTLLAAQLLLQLVQALGAGPAAAGHAQPKIGIGADLAGAERLSEKVPVR